jgi:hypothetical protein
LWQWFVHYTAISLHVYIFIRDVPIVPSAPTLRRMVVIVLRSCLHSRLLATIRWSNLERLEHLTLYSYRIQHYWFNDAEFI